MDLKNEIKKKQDALYYILHYDEKNKKQAEYDKLHKEEKLQRDREYHARKRLVEMKGLCHICYTSNTDVFNHKGQIICGSCLEEHTNDK